MSDEMKTGYKAIKVDGRDAWRFADGTIVPRFCGGTDDPPAGPPADPPADPPEPKKVDMTQVELNTLIDKKYADAHTKAEAKSRDEIDALKVKIEDLKAAPPKGDKGGNEDVTALTDRIAVLESREIESKQRNSHATLLTVAAELNAVNGNQVAQLIQPHIKMAEDGTLSVINAEGQVRMNAGGQPMTAKELVAEFLTANPHLVKAAGRPGSGSQSPNMSAKDNEAFNNLPPVERLKLARKQEVKT